MGPARRADMTARIYPRIAWSEKKSGRAGRQHQRLQHLRGAAVLHESDHSRVLGYRPGKQRQDAPLKQPGIPGEGERALPLQDDIVVGERLAAVLPGRDSPAQLILV